MCIVSQFFSWCITKSGVHWLAITMIRIENHSEPDFTFPAWTTALRQPLIVLPFGTWATAASHPHAICTHEWKRFEIWHHRQNKFRLIFLNFVLELQLNFALHFIFSPLIPHYRRKLQKPLAESTSKRTRGKNLAVACGSTERETECVESRVKVCAFDSEADWTSGYY